MQLLLLRTRRAPACGAEHLVRATARVRARVRARSTVGLGLGLGSCLCTLGLLELALQLGLGPGLVSSLQLACTPPLQLGTRLLRVALVSHSLPPSAACVGYV